MATLPIHTITTYPIHHNRRFSPSNRAATCRTLQLAKPTSKRCEYIDLHDVVVPYEKAWDLQKTIVEEKKALIEKNEECPDTIIVLQHPSVYTLGTGSSEEFLNFDVKNPPYDIFRTERGGEVTYHGPGQLIVYPIINLRNHKMDLHWYLRTLEEVVIQALSSAFSIKTSRLEGLTGVWFGNQKLAAIGVRVSKWIAYHGLALNVSVDLTPFQHIVPCGIRDRKVGNIKQVLKENQELTMDDSILIDIAHKSLMDQFSQVFQLQLEQKSLPKLYLCKEESKGTKEGFALL